MKFLVEPHSFSPENPVVLYAGSDFQGRAQMLGPGRYHMLQLSVGTIGSLRVPATRMLTLLSEGALQERRFAGDTPHLSETSPVTAVVILPAVAAYAKPGYAGISRTLPAGRYRLETLAAEGFEIASLKIPPELSVTLFDHPDRGGGGRQFSEDLPEMEAHLDTAAATLVISPFDAASLPGALNFGDIISLKSNGGRFFGVDGKGRCSAESDHIGLEEEFTLVRSGRSKSQEVVYFGDVVSLRSRRELFLSAGEEGMLSAEGQEVSDAERFILFRSGGTTHHSVACGDDTVSLRSLATGRFLSVVIPAAGEKHPAGANMKSGGVQEGETAEKENAPRRKRDLLPAGDAGSCEQNDAVGASGKWTLIVSEKGAATGLGHCA